MGSELEQQAETVDERPGAAADRPPVEVTDLPRGTTIDRYVVIDKVGQGGMGVVYSAYDDALHRRVALKLVTSRRDREGQARLLAEARTMAQLSHSTLVAVYDVGELGRQVFLAMEFIDGETLRKWQARTHSWQEVVAMYRTLGRGLAYAHAAGVVHRDFKPDNVIVDAQGEPHVTDFGLAKVEPADDNPSTSLITKHTISGKIAGTPGYMSPEQRMGEPTDARTDQYSFSAALYEALHGVLPDQPATNADVPREVAAAIRRGLEDDPARRWPTLEALLDALAPRRRRWWLFAPGAAAVALGVGGWLVLSSGDTRATCEAPEAQVAWQGARDRVQQAFTQHGARADALIAAIDRWTERWTEMARASCRATAARTQSTQLLDLRTQCLQHALDVARGVYDLAAKPDRELIAGAGELATHLPSIEPCADAKGLLGVAPLPSDPARRAAIEALRKDLAPIEALYQTKHLDAADKAVRPLLARARDLDYPPVLFDVSSTSARISVDRAVDPKAAANALWAALAIEPTRADIHSARLWLELIWVIGVAQTQVDYALQVAQVAEAVVHRAGNAFQRATLDYRLGVILANAKRYDEALARYERARVEFQLDHDPLGLIAVLQGKANVFQERGNVAGALPIHQQIAAELERLGKDYEITLAKELDAIAGAYVALDRVDEALAAIRRAVAIVEPRSADVPPLAVLLYSNLGDLLHRKADLLHRKQDLVAAEAAVRRALEIGEQSPESGTTQNAWFTLGTIQVDRGEKRDARASYERALAILEHVVASGGDPGEYMSAKDIREELAKL